MQAAPEDQSRARRPRAAWARTTFAFSARRPASSSSAVVDAKADAPADLGSVPFLRSIAELSKVDFDAAVIATPTATHHDVALELIAMGKHLLVEKPIASTYAEGREVLAAAHAKNVKLAVGHVERFNPAVRKLREIIKRGLARHAHPLLVHARRRLSRHRAASATTSSSTSPSTTSTCCAAWSAP